MKDGELSEVNSIAAGPVCEEPEDNFEEYEVDDFEEDTAEAGETEHEFYDSVTGAMLDPSMVDEARKEELEWIHRRKIYEVVPLSEAKGKLVTLKWVDVDKGGAGQPHYRSRLVAREIRRKGKRVLPDAQLFSSMPPLEALKMMISIMMTMRKSKRNKKD